MSLQKSQTITNPRPRFKNRTWGTLRPTFLQSATVISSPCGQCQPFKPIRPGPPVQLLLKGQTFLAEVRPLPVAQDTDRVGASNDSLAPILCYLSRRLNHVCERNSEVSARQCYGLYHLRFYRTPYWPSYRDRDSLMCQDRAKGRSGPSTISKNCDTIGTACSKRGIYPARRSVRAMDIVSRPADIFPSMKRRGWHSLSLTTKRDRQDGSSSL